MANNRPKILLVDDDRPSCEQIEDILSLFNYEVVSVDSAAGALAIVNEVGFDSIVLSVELTDGGFELSQDIKAIEGCEDIPVAFITAVEPDQALMMEAQFYGAMFLFKKPCSDVELMTQLSSMVRIKVLQDELKLKMAELDQMASTDPLTGLYNRRLLFQRLEEEVSRATRQRLPLCVLFIDIDHFKKTNDTYGHQAGDMVLKQLAVIFRRVLRVSDVVGRYGGEEFMIMLPDTKDGPAREVAERLRKRVEQAVFEFDETRIPVTISIGLYFAGDVITEKVDDLVNAADAALYEAKETGRNKVVFRRAAPAKAEPENAKSDNQTG